MFQRKEDDVLQYPRTQSLSSSRLRTMYLQKCGKFWHWKIVQEHRIWYGRFLTSCRLIVVWYWVQFLYYHYFFFIRRFADLVKLFTFWWFGQRKPLFPPHYLIISRKKGSIWSAFCRVWAKYGNIEPVSTKQYIYVNILTKALGLGNHGLNLVVVSSPLKCNSYICI